MGFENIDSWKSIENVTVLYPSSLKPIHGGHIDLIRKYSELPEVSEVRVLIGPGVRGGISQNKALSIAERLLIDIPKVVVEAVTWPSPVLTAFKIIEEAEPGIYALAASSKGEDYQRVKDFVTKHSPGGKYTPAKGIRVIELPVDSSPMIFRGRTDSNNGRAISASILRMDIVNDDIENFSTGYPNCSIDDIAWVWDQIASDVMNESVFSTGPSPETSAGNYDRSARGYHYKSLFPILEDGEEEEDISEGGAAGHMMSPWEAYDLTFGEIKDIIDKALTGKLQNVTEKLDGQNIMVTVRGGNVYLARNQSQMRDAAINAIKWDQVYNSFGPSTPEFIKKAFSEALSDFQKVFKRSDLDLKTFFDGGKRWLNIELLNPETENIVPYGEFQLRIHNMIEVDDAGKEKNIILKGGYLDAIIGSIERVQKAGDLEKIHYIGKTNEVIFNQIAESEKIKADLIKRVNSLMKPNYLDDSNNIGDYLSEEIRRTTAKKIKDTELLEKLVQRWAYGNKTLTILHIMKGQSDTIKKWIREEENRMKDKLAILLDPIIEIFSRLGIAVLQNLSGIAASDPGKVSEKMRKKTLDSIEKIKGYMAKTEVSDPVDFRKKIEYLELQLRRLNRAGGLDGIAPTEGIVFEYNGRLFKLTGIYLPILKMINFFQFGKDK